MTTKCRCGFDGTGFAHPCHGRGYECQKPSTQRFYSPKFVALAGVQMKVQMLDTWACDECWKEYTPLISEQNNGR